MEAEKGSCYLKRADCPRVDGRLFSLPRRVDAEAGLPTGSRGHIRQTQDISWGRRGGWEVTVQQKLGAESPPILRGEKGGQNGGVRWSQQSLGALPTPNARGE